LPDCISLGVVFGASEMGLDGLIASFQVKDSPVEVGTDGMVAIVAPLPATLQLHACFLQTNQTMMTIDFIFYDTLQNGAVTDTGLKLDLVVSDLD
jgi:hypothetical protein